MLETGRLARRDAALPTGGEGPVRVLPAASRFSLRVKGVAVPPRDPPPAGGGGRREAPDGGGSPDRVGPAPDRASRDSPSPAGEGSAASFATDVLALPVTRCAVSGERLLARLGPDEWLVLGPEADTDALAAEIAASLAGRFHALVDVSHRSIALEVSGPAAADILNAGCPLDLHASAFPPGSATRTLLGKAEIVLIRPSEAPAFRVECWRSFATYVQGFLTEAARDS